MTFIGLKTTEALLGIETLRSLFQGLLYWSQNYWSPFRDWNTFFARDNNANCLKTTEALLGIETPKDKDLHQLINRLKTTEALLGIETFPAWLSCWRLKSLKTTEALLGIETWLQATHPQQ